MTKQVTQEQLDTWLADPVTQAYLECAQYCLDQTRKNLADGKGVIPNNADLTLFNHASIGGRRDTLIEVLSPKEFLGAYERPEVANV